MVHLVCQQPSQIQCFLLMRSSWWFQGLIFTGLWVLGHEVRPRANAAPFDSDWLVYANMTCDPGSAVMARSLPASAFATQSASYVHFSHLLCFFAADPRTIDWSWQVLHSLLWTPYFSWKISHHRHHMHHGSMERDEVYVPKTRADLGIPVGQSIDWEEHFGDTPLYTLFTLVRQQLFAFPAYLRMSLFIVARFRR